MEIVQNIKMKNENIFSRLKRRELSYGNKLLLMALPFIILVFVFYYLPLWGWAIAFVDYSPGVSIFKSTFVGFNNFLELFTFTAEFPMAMRNTLIMSLLGILATPLAPVLAILITEIRGTKYKKIIQTATSLPNFMSWVIVYSVAFSFFSIGDGVINNLLLKLNIIQNPTNVLGDVNIIWYVQALSSIWKSVGWSAIIYIGAISGIEQELYEAANVDGAGRFKQVLHITIPGILPTFVVLLFLSVGWMLSGNSFEQIYCFHNALVHDNIQTLDYYAYNIGLRQLNYSLATAVGVFKTLVSILLLSISGLASKKLIGRSII